MVAIKTESLFILLISVFPLSIAFFIALNGHNVPYRDQWDALIPVAVATTENNITSELLFTQHNEHRIVFTKLTTVGFTLTTSWNIHWELSISWILACINLGLIYLLWRTTLPLSIGYTVILSAIVFSFRQHENWLWGITNHSYWVMLFILLGLVFISYRPVNYVTLTLVILCGYGAMFSFGSGGLVWIVFPLVLWGHGYRELNHYIVWFVAAILLAIAYFIILDYRSIIDERSYNPLLLLIYMFTFIGSSLTLSDIVNFFIGGLGVGVFFWNAHIYFKNTNNIRTLSLWVTLALMVMLGGILSGNGRIQTDFGLSNAAASKHATVSNLFWIALLAIGSVNTKHALIRYNQQSKISSLLKANLLVTIFATALFLYGTITSLNGNNFRSIEKSDIICLETVPQTQDAWCLNNISQPLATDPENQVFHDIVLEQVNQLYHHQLTFFSSK